MLESYRNRYVILIVVLVSVLMSVIDGIVVGIALPTITGFFQVGVAQSQWAISAYLVTITGLLLVFGKVSERTGRPPLFVTGLLIFTAGSLACGLSRSLTALIVFRVVQAIGGAMTFSISGAILYHGFPPQERGRAMGLLGSTVAIGSILGPILGGFIVDSLGWQYIFLINVPIGVVLIGGSLIFLRESEGAKKDFSMDWIGAAALLVSLVSLILFMGGAAEGGSAVRGAIPSGALFLAASVMFVLRERRAKEPLLDLSIFANKRFTAPVVRMMLAFISIFMINIAGPFYFQGVMGYSPSQVGLVFLIVPLVTMIGSPVSGWLFDKHYWRHYGMVGMLVIGASLLVLAFLSWKIDFTLMIPAMAALGLGNALYQSPNSTEIMNALPRDKVGIASSVTATVRNLGMTLGTSIATLLISLQIFATGYHGAILQAGGPLLSRVIAIVFIAAAALAVAAAFVI